MPFCKYFFHHKGRSCLLLFLALCVLASTRTHAQQQFEPSSIILFTPTTGGHGWFSREYAKISKHLTPYAGLWLSYTHQPLVGFLGERQRFSVVNYQLTVDVVGSFSLFGFLEFGIGIPAVPTQAGDGLAKIPDQPAFSLNALSLGDLRFSIKAPLFAWGRLSVAAQFVITLPTGDNRNFTGDPSVTGLPRLIAQLNFLKNRLIWSGDAGVRLRQARQLANLNMGHELVVGSSLAYHLIPEVLEIGTEIYVHAGLNFKRLQETPIVLLAGLKYRVGKFVFSVGAGGGLTSGYGAPQFQVLTSVAFFPQQANLIDEPERLPEPDLPNALEANKSEVIVTRERLAISDRIYFEFDSDIISPVSYRILNRVSEILTSTPRLQFIRVEGHTDNIGGETYNQDLSSRRAQSVMNYLIEHGVDPGRLGYHGFGFSKPKTSNDTELGRATNRRVEFIIERQEVEK